MGRNWAEDLPSDVIVLIARRVGSYDAYFAFRRVCRSWRWATKNEKFNPNSSSPQIPWLMRLGRRSRGVGKAYSLSTGEKMGKLAVPPDAISSEPRCYFESQGWFFFTPETEDAYCLWNLFSGAEISLPKAFYGSVHRAALHFKSGSASNMSDSEIMVFGLDNDLFRWMFWRFGDTEWTKLMFAGWERYRCFKYHLNGQLYASTPLGKVMVVHRQNPSLAYSEQIVNIPNLPNYWLTHGIHNVDSYLVDLSTDSLLAVWKHRCSEEFHIYEVDLVKRRYKKVTDLGDNAIFLGHSCSSTALVKVVAPHSKIKANHIYYCVPLTMKIRVYSLMRVKKASTVHDWCGIFVTPAPP